MDSSNVDTTVYRSLGQVWKTLGEHQSRPEVQGLLDLCYETGLINDAVERSSVLMGNVTPNYVNDVEKNPPFPFVVIEGLDGTGKTTLTKHLSSSLGMQLVATPPKIPVVQAVRKYFDDQPETIRRAFYSLGNYFASHEVLKSKHPVVMDRFWHSTAAYALAHVQSIESMKAGAGGICWPSDLLQPHLVVFLTVSEQERIKRHTNRHNFTNTEEEQKLAADAEFRKNLVEYYRSITGPEFLELNVDGHVNEVKKKVLSAVLDRIPGLTSGKDAAVNAPG